MPLPRRAGTRDVRDDLVLVAFGFAVLLCFLPSEEGGGLFSAFSGTFSETWAELELEACMYLCLCKLCCARARARAFEPPARAAAAIYSM